MHGGMPGDLRGVCVSGLLALLKLILEVKVRWRDRDAAVDQKD